MKREGFSAACDICRSAAPLNPKSALTGYEIPPLPPLISIKRSSLVAAGRLVEASRIR